MKLIGHVYVALKAFPQKDRKLLAYGSLLPETVFYTKDPALSYEQIHEGGLKLYHFCQKNYPQYVDLALGAMSHSVKYGADKFNSINDIRKLGFTESDIPKIADALEIDEKTAKVRAHNLYDLALDFYTYKKHPNIIQDIESTKEIDNSEVSKILAECYGEPQDQIKGNLDGLWDKYDLTLMETFEGVAKFWQILAADLKEKDPTNIEKTAKLLEDFYNRLEGTADGFLDEVIESTRSRVCEAL